MSSNNEFMRCQVCIMDQSDPEIEFFGNQGCNHCIMMKSTLGLNWFKDDTGIEQLKLLIKKIKSERQTDGYDCIIGLSGGADSTYLALKAYEWGLRPLIVHVDAGWNSELAVRNIEALVKFTGWDLYTQVIDWPEMLDLQISYLKSGVANQDVPQDHAFFASLFSLAAKHKIKYILSGGNVSTEGILPRSWQGSAMDAINLKEIHSMFGNTPLHRYPTVSFLEYYFINPFIKRIRIVRPLNLMAYNKDDAVKELEEKIGYVKYARKHGESNFTRFFQEFYLVSKFGIDKRIAHLSSRIISGQITRESALIEMQNNLFDEMEYARLKQHICRKLRLDREEFDNLLSTPIQNADAFKNWNRQYFLMKKVQRVINKVVGFKLNLYR